MQQNKMEQLIRFSLLLIILLYLLILLLHIVLLWTKQLMELIVTQLQVLHMVMISFTQTLTL